jgi:hypothetical protein
MICLRLSRLPRRPVSVSISIPDPTRRRHARHGLGDQLREEILDATKVKRGLGRGVLVG